VIGIYGIKIDSRCDLIRVGVISNLYLNGINPKIKHFLVLPLSVIV
jgi:hypothetical protein